MGFVTITGPPFRRPAQKVLVKRTRNFGLNLTNQTKWLDNRIKSSLQKSIVATFIAPAETNTFGAFLVFRDGVACQKECFFCYKVEKVVETLISKDYILFFFFFLILKCGRHNTKKLSSAS